ncbi:MAG: cysteine desulfurase [Lachnospiraceae bacterium]|nr:cysteine desulfurase [Lachnospiraceae bacterium]
MTESIREIYLDNAATTRTDDEVCALVEECMRFSYGNPASLHEKGMEAEKYVKAAREAIAETLGTDPKTILFTSGGTESNNIAILGTALAKQRAGKHLVTTSVEHPSVRNPFRFLEEQGFEVTYLPVDRDGLVSVNELRNAIRPDTILVSVMHVNNEIGAVEPVEEIGTMLKKEFPSVTFHVDAIQAYGKYQIRPKRSGIDLLSASGHKIHGPKGTGFLYIAENVKIRPILFGGGQQKNMRSGTENVPGEAGLGLAAEKMYKMRQQIVASMYERKQQLIDGLLTIDGTHINGKIGKESAPHIVSCTFDGVRSEVLLHSLGSRGIYVSSGSACASGHPSEITTLAAIGLQKEKQEGTIRFSFSDETTEEEIRITLDALREILPVLRRYVRR